MDGWTDLDAAFVNGRVGTRRGCKVNVDMGGEHYERLRMSIARRGINNAAQDVP